MKRDLDDPNPISAEIKRSYEWTGDDRADYVKQACSWMWKVLETEVIRDPFVWEPWRYVHRFIDLERSHRIEEGQASTLSVPITTADLIFDEERFAMAGVEGEDYLFDRRLYRFYPITGKFRTVLEGAKKDRSSIVDLDTSMIEKLVSMRVLVRSRTSGMEA